MIAELFAYRQTYKTAQWFKLSTITPLNYIHCYGVLFDMERQIYKVGENMPTEFNPRVGMEIIFLSDKSKGKVVKNNIDGKLYIDWGGQYEPTPIDESGEFYDTIRECDWDF